MDDLENSVQTAPGQDQLKQSLEDTLTIQRQSWLDEVTALNEMMKTLPKTDEMMNKVYIVRQKCVESFYAMNALILKHTRNYKKKYTETFNNIKMNGYNGIRYTTDQAINRAVESVLEDSKFVIDQLNNHNNYIKDTIASIDNIIYGINQKVKIQEIMNGLKF